MSQVKGGDRVEVFLEYCYHPTIAVLDGAIGYIQRVTPPSVVVLFPPTKSRGQLQVTMPLKSVKQKKES